MGLYGEQRGEHQIQIGKRLLQHGAVFTAEIENAHITEAVTHVLQNLIRLRLVENELITLLSMLRQANFSFI